MSLKISVVIPSYRDYDGLFITVPSLNLYHKGYFDEIVVLDTDPKGPQSEATRNLCALAGARYHEYNGVQGTAPAKNAAIDLASYDYFLLLDSHVFVTAGGLSALRSYFYKYPNTGDLIHGPLHNEGAGLYATHQEMQWRGQNKGVWATDLSYMQNPVSVIPAHGTGLFAGKKDKWLRFNKDFKGFGGEECYIHDKYRAAGRKVILLRDLGWVHRFHRTQGLQYAVKIEDKVINYAIGMDELGQDKKPLIEHMVQEGHNRELIECLAMTKDCGCKKPSGATLEQNARLPSDINEHFDTLKELASKCEVVVDGGSREYGSTVALAHGKPKSLYMISANPPSVDKELAAYTKMYWLQGGTLTCAAQECDMVFLDTEPHTYDSVSKELDRWGKFSKRYIVVHDTEAPHGPQVMPAIRDFVRRTYFRVVAHYKNNHGLTVLSCDSRDFPPDYPSYTRMAYNYAKSTAKHIANGGKTVPLEIAEERKAICHSNGGRCPSAARNVDEDRCTACGCPIADKVLRPMDSCPLGNWGVYDGERNES